MVADKISEKEELNVHLNRCEYHSDTKVGCDLFLLGFSLAFSCNDEESMNYNVHFNFYVLARMCKAAIDERWHTLD